MSITAADIEKKLATYVDPYLNQDLVTAKVVKEINVQDHLITLRLVMGYPCLGAQEEMKLSLVAMLADITPIDVHITIDTHIVTHVGQRGLKALPTIKNIIAVASGKGGVGKSTTAVNLAIALAEEGARVGILDADIYGPSQPLMLGVTTRPELNDKKVLVPVVRHGVQSMSIGYLIDETAPMVWRGPMVSMALQQLLNDTQWDNLDYLIVDLPPGTGDVQLTLAQKIPVSAAVIVTTPQDLALLDARRAYEMFQKVNVPVLGVIENMSVHVCSQCGHVEHIFGEGGGGRLAEQYGLQLLGSLPLDLAIRADTDNGIPTVAKDPNAKLSKIYRDVARTLAAKLSLQAQDYSHKFPTIIIKND
jgi:ATP-binding protein involved in chromosome partitioning